MMYSAVFAAVTVSAAQDVFELVAPSDACVIVHSLTLGQSSDYGDAQAEGLSIKAIRGFTTSGSGGSSVTSAPLEFGAAAAGSAVEANNTTVASSGTTQTHLADAFNVQIGYQHRPTPEERIILSPSQRLVFNITAPADAVTLSGTLIFEEIGG